MTTCSMAKCNMATCVLWLHVQHGPGIRRANGMADSRLSPSSLSPTPRRSSAEEPIPAPTLTVEIWTPVQYDHLCSMVTRAIWPSVQYGHLCSIDGTHLCSVATCTCSMAICAVWPPVQYGHPCSMATRAMWTPVQYGHPCNTATPAMWPPVQYGHPCDMATCAGEPD